MSHQLGPEQLVGSEHHAILESGIDESLDITIDFLDRIAPDESRNPQSTATSTNDVTAGIKPCTTWALGFAGSSSESGRLGNEAHQER